MTVENRNDLRGRAQEAPEVFDTLFVNLVAAGETGGISTRS